MSLVDIFSRKKKVKGSIGYYRLEEWWLSAFSDQERRSIEQRFKPLGGAANSLVEGEVGYASRSAVGFLHDLAGWFGKTEDRPIARKILAKAEELLGTTNRILDAHFFFGQKLAIYYKDRNDPAMLEVAIEACRQQIALAGQAADAFAKEYKGSPLPSHKGYEQLVIILDSQGRYREAIDFCQTALNQGWAGDWEKRIERLNGKLARA